MSFAGSTAPGPLVASLSGSGPTYTITVTGMSGSGIVRATIPPGAVNDAAGNPSIVSTSTDNSVLFVAPGPDVTSPTVTVEQGAGQADPASSGPVLFDVAFSEPVFGLSGADISLSGSAPGALVAQVSGSGAHYVISVSGMTGPGVVVASIQAGRVTDAAGNANTASTSVDNRVTYSP